MPGAGGAGGISAGSSVEGNPRLAAAGGPRSVPEEHGSAGKRRAPKGCSPPCSGALRAPRLRHSGSWEGKHGSSCVTRAPGHVGEPGAEAWLRHGTPRYGWDFQQRGGSRALPRCGTVPNQVGSIRLHCCRAPQHRAASEAGQNPETVWNTEHFSGSSRELSPLRSPLPPSHFFQLNRGTNKPSPTPRRWLGSSRGEDACCWATSHRANSAQPADGQRRRPFHEEHRAQRSFSRGLEGLSAHFTAHPLPARRSDACKANHFLVHLH